MMCNVQFYMDGNGALSEGMAHYGNFSYSE